MGGDLTDGVGFLNLFETAGLDASVAASDRLTKAIKNLKPGQTLDDLIAQIGAIEDPILQRPQKARSSSAQGRSETGRGDQAGHDLARRLQGFGTGC
jgi:hypothetical protein